MKHSVFGISIVIFLALVMIFLPFGQVQVQAKEQVQEQVPAQVQALAASVSKVATLIIPPGVQQYTLRYWTHDVMNKTAAMPLMVDTGIPLVGKIGGVETQEALGTMSSAPGAADPKAIALAQQAFPDDWKAADLAGALESSDQEMAGTFNTFDSYSINSLTAAQTIYPHRYVGRLYFKTAAGSGAYCSATAISGNNFVTAAHCVYDTTANTWNNSWAFTPAYRAGSAPFGTFPATACTILTAWVNLTGSYSIVGWTPYDVAVCTAGPNAAGTLLNAAVGFAGRTWDGSFTRHFFNMGYPWYNTSGQSLSGAGAYLRTCVGESYNQFFPLDVLGMGCDFGPGISGGPWLIGYKQAVVSGYVNSVNSGYYVGNPSMYGIRFTSNNIVPICTVRGC